jgi:hypothetical protein
MADSIGTFATGNVQDNEIVKAADFQFAFESLIDNFSKFGRMVLESRQNFVVGGKVYSANGMNLRVKPIYGVNYSTATPFGCVTDSPATASGSTTYITIAQGSDKDRIDAIGVKGVWTEYDEQQRSFRDFDTETDTIQNTNTKKTLSLEYEVFRGESGSYVAPEVDSDYVKIAEVLVPANAVELSDDDIRNITIDVAGGENPEWTNEKDSTYNIGYISDVNERFRVLHEADGSFKENIVGTDELKIGTASGELNASVLPVAGQITIAEKTAGISDSVRNTISVCAEYITELFNAYLKDGTYAFNGEVSVSDLADTGTNALVNAFFFGTDTDSDGSRYAYVRYGEKRVIRIYGNGVIRGTEDYSAADRYDLVNKAVTDAISSELSTVSGRVKYLEDNADPTSAVNRVFSKFSVANDISIAAATTAGITLSGLQIIDGYSVSAGDMVLVKNQTDASENGIYEVSASNDWARNSSFASSDTMSKKFFVVQNGKANKGRIFFVLRDSFVLGEDTVDFLEYYGSISPIADKVALRDSEGHVKAAAAKSDSDCLIKADLLNLIYPVGSLYWSSRDTNPANLFGGTWEQIKDKFVLAAGDTYEVNATGGASTVTLTEEELPSHSHTFSGNKVTGKVVFFSGPVGNTVGVFSKDSSTNCSWNNHSETGYSGLNFSMTPSGTISSTGSGNAHENMPPYVVKYCWERTA